ncbi:hypothetical protein PAPYR_11439 [Paratrimastix pyriformis]|uniref:Uncharacterized protein n=1 Tax=Paratrimastix pyriformis TaxID=342808 RepID=A0ABQ8U7V6_9EUKA|nr:hypothetical protein PAPYR_12839 [Paratrimastix pyriformis]KAJ4453969.1 hypothetical protein PAPYR_11439 [Paratrimastix pyriformis]
MLFPWDSNHRNQLPITFLSRNICPVTPSHSTTMNHGSDRVPHFPVPSHRPSFTKLTVVDISYIPSSRYHDHIPSLYKTNFSEQSPFLTMSQSLFSPHPEGTYAFPPLSVELYP